MDNTMEKEFTYDIVDELLTIDTSSAYHFEQQQVEQARTEWKYQRMYAEAFRAAQEAEMRLEIVTAEIVEELFSVAKAAGSPIPPSSRSEIRRSKVPVDPRWQEAKSAWIVANETANIMTGAIKSLYSKGFRLNSIQKMVERQLFNAQEPGGDKVTNRNIENRMGQSGSQLI